MNRDILPGPEQGHITGSGAGRDPGREGEGHMSSGPGPEGRDLGQHVTGFGGRVSGLGEHIIGTRRQDETRPETIPHATH